MIQHLDERAFDLLIMADGDASPETQGFRAHAAECDSCAASLAEREALRDEFEAEVLPRMLGKVRAEVATVEAPRPVARLREHLRWAVPVLAVAAVALLMMRPRVEEDAGLGALSIKGGTGLNVWVKRTDRIFEPRSGEALRAGDALQFVVWPGAQRSLMIGSVDGAGHVSIYLPQQGDHGVGIEPSRRYEAPISITLDATPGRECVFSVLGAEPIARESVERALGELAARGPDVLRGRPRLALSGASQDVFCFDKAQP
jgi:hypothetical protein